MSKSKTYLHPEVLNKLNRLELRARAVVEGFISGMHRSPYHGFSVEFAQHREYSPGDDIRHIDWRVYGKSDRFYIKQYEESTNLRCMIALDCSESMAYPQHREAGRMSKWDYAATLAASIAYLQNRQQDAVGLLLFDSDVRFQLPPASTPGQLANLLSVLENNTPAHQTDAKMLFGRLASHMSKRGMVVIVSDLLADPDTLIAGMNQLIHRGHEVVVLHVLDHDELEFPFFSRVHFDGLERSLDLRTDPQSLRQSYLQAVREFISRIRSFCVNHGIEYVSLSTVDPLDRALAGFLAKRMHVIRTMSR